MTRFGWLILLALLVLCSLVVAMGRVDERFDFEAAMEMWSDLVRDADRPAYQLTRVSDAEEMALGTRLAATYPAPGNTGWESYVQAVGSAVAAHARRGGIRYQFHVLDEPFANAWALPGGQIFITAEMLNFIENEAELAGILGHEIGHVDLYRCIERYQFELKAKHIGVPGAGELADIAHSLVSATYQQYQELDADAAGVRYASEAGYDPGATEIVFARMRGVPSRSRPEAPVPAVTGAMIGALGRFLESHPPSEERQRRLAALVARNNSMLQHRRFYLGRKNYQSRTPLSQVAYPDEWVQY